MVNQLHKCLLHPKNLIQSLLTNLLHDSIKILMNSLYFYNNFNSIAKVILIIKNYFLIYFMILGYLNLIFVFFLLILVPVILFFIYSSRFLFLTHHNLDQKLNCFQIEVGKIH